MEKYSAMDVGSDAGLCPINWVEIVGFFAAGSTINLISSTAILKNFVIK